MATYYPDQISRLLGLLEVMVGIAFIISPLVSAQLYNWVGYAGTFWIYAGMNIICGFILILCFPKKEEDKKIEV